MPNFLQETRYGKAINYTKLEESIRLITRISIRQTCIEIPMNGWNETQLDERLLGVSITGAQDVFQQMNWETGGEEIECLLKAMNEWANNEADIYSKQLNIPRPLLVTTIKPEGTASQVYGVSNGLHWDWSPFYIRRVRMTSADALAQTLMDQGFPCYPEVYDLWKLSEYTEYESEELNKLTDWEKLDIYINLDSYTKRYILNSCNTVVFEFPVKSFAKRTQADVSAIEQLENVKSFTVHYTDHMPSSTISVKDGEWDLVAEWLYDNWDTFITASFFPYYGGNYPLLPYEEIDETEYNRRISAIGDSSKVVLQNGRVTFKVNTDLLNQYERYIEDPDNVELPGDCNTKGACPVR